ncbi:hypothetical protein HK097_007533 [Rhizophlyctis rosea]|uniref:Uncharacterized protein n=1 Tax=Rhizophlyctis rosea TaxID=64517 RepID=A0AAD5X4H7_9FUNG|nr:hypothetical protein HK097_007533 [Rhizophlyctis rosea]
MSNIMDLLKKLTQLVVLHLTMDANTDEIPSALPIIGVAERSRFAKLETLELTLDGYEVVFALARFLEAVRMSTASLKLLRILGHGRHVDPLSEPWRTFETALKEMRNLRHFESSLPVPISIFADTSLTGVRVTDPFLAGTWDALETSTTSLESLLVPCSMPRDTNAFADKVSKFENLRILDLNWIHSLTIMNLETIIEGCQKLEEISMRSFAEENAETIVERLETSPVLKIVDIRDNFNPNPLAFGNGSYPQSSTTSPTKFLRTNTTPLSEPPHWSTLWESYKLTITPNDIHPLLLFPGNSATTLTTLHITIASHFSISDTEFKILAAGAPNIEHFTFISRFGTTITDAGLITVVETWHKTLRVLRLHRFPSVKTSPELAQSFKRCTNLRHLSLSWCGPEKSNVALHHLPQIISSLQRNTFRVLEIVHPHWSVRKTLVDALVRKFGPIASGPLVEGEPAPIASLCSSSIHRISILGPKTSWASPVEEIPRLAAALPWLAELELCLSGSKSAVDGVKRLVVGKFKPRRVRIWNSGEGVVMAPSGLGPRRELLNAVHLQGVVPDEMGIRCDPYIWWG